jgi:transmembrane sensor
VANDDRDPFDAEQLRRLLDGELPPDEAARLRQAIADATGRSDAVDAAIEAVRADGLWQDFVRRRASTTPKRFMPRPRVSVAWRVTQGLAAAITILAAGLYMTRRGSAEPFQEFASAPGSRITIAMRDGSRVVLGPASRIRVPRDFGSAARTVDLAGEAFFTVVHDARRPFAVQTGRAIVRDVGTTFAVRAYADDSADRVAVEEGQVSVEGRRRTQSSAKTSLVAGDVATATDSGTAVVHGAHLAPLTAWVQDGLAFEGTPLRDVVRDISRTFDVDIVVADSALVARRVTASFVHEPLDVVLKAVTEVVGAHYERSARTIVIRRGAGSKSVDPRPVTALQEPHVHSK